MMSSICSLTSSTSIGMRAWLILYVVVQVLACRLFNAMNKYAGGLPFLSVQSYDFRTIFTYSDESATIIYKYNLFVHS